MQNAFRGLHAGFGGREANGGAVPQEQATMTWVVSTVQIQLC